MLVIKTKKDIASYVATHPSVLECKKTWEEGEEYDPGSFDEVVEELVKLIAIGDDSPDFGDDWEAWLAKNIEELLQEAVSIVM